METKKPGEYSKTFEISFVLTFKKTFNIIFYHKNSTFLMIINLFFTFLYPS